MFKNHHTPQDEREIVAKYRRMPYQAVRIGDEFVYLGERVQVVGKVMKDWEMLAVLSNGVEVNHHQIWLEVRGES